MQPAALPRMPVARARFTGAPLVCGIATLLTVAGLALPGTVQAQAAGTMQVVANVARADQAWAGLYGAQALARSLDRSTGLPRRQQVDVALARIRWESPVRGVARPAVARVTIQYLHN